MAMSGMSTKAASSCSLCLLLLLSLATHVSAQSVLPSNITIPPPLSGVDLKLLLLEQKIRQSRFTVAPLTREAGLNATAPELQTWNVAGTLKLVDDTTANSVTNNDIAYITCDSNDSNIGPDRVVQATADKNPKAILLFSTSANYCNLTGSFNYPSIYTTTSIRDSTFLEMSFQVMSPEAGRPINARIATNSSSTPTPQGTNNDGGPAPTTAVAMSILYSVTGIITLLFLVIITTGALRAHRNPERYGPRTAFGGRPRQSRAKGLARAMLETIPIVKFGDPEPAKPNRDIELEDGTSSVHTPPVVASTDKNKDQTSEQQTKSAAPASTNPPNTAVASGLGPAQADSVKSGEEAQGDGELGCSICTEDFTTGEDVRVLPCDHKFHPACVDPWLLNISGTCPLCRHDLNTAARESEEGGLEGNGSEPAQPVVNDGHILREDPAFRARRRASSILHLHRLRSATPSERIAALRALREQSRAEGGTVEGSAVEDVEEPTRRARLAERLRDRFRIRTSPQPPPAPEGGFATRTHAPFMIEHRT